MEVELHTDASREAVEAADSASGGPRRGPCALLHPESVAVVGVRRSAGGFGHGVLEAIRARPTPGPSTWSTPRRTHRRGTNRRSLEALDAPVDLVVVAVPADGVAEVIRDAVANRAGAAVVISSGFSGNGQRERRQELLTLARAHSLRLVGPNSQGVLVNGAGLNATLLHDVPQVGGLAVASQSGGMGFALLDLARDVGVGVQAFVSLGDKVDVSSNDLLAAWMDDDEVAAGALYLESFGNALKFARTARRFAEQKPLLAVVGGRSRARQDPAAVSTVGVGRRRAARPVRGDRLPTGAELAETALLLVEQPLPAGLRVCIVSNTGGVGALTTDRAERQGMVVARCRTSCGATLRAAVPGRGRRPQPGGPRGRRHARGAHGRAACRARRRRVRRRPGPAGRQPAHRPRRAVRRRRPGAASGADVPLLLVTPGAAFDAARGLPGVTVYRTTDAAIGALGRAMRYAAWRRVPADQPRSSSGPAASTPAPGRGRGWPPAAASRSGARPGQAELLAPYGIHLVGRLATGPDEARRPRRRSATRWPSRWPTRRCSTSPTAAWCGSTCAPAADVADAVRRFAEELGRDRVDVLVQPLVLGHSGSVRPGPATRSSARWSGSPVGAAGPAGSWAEEVLLLPPVGAADAARAVRALRSGRELRRRPRAGGGSTSPRSRRW